MLVSGANADAIAAITEQILELEAGLDQLTFREYVALANPKFVWHRHNEILGEALQAVVDGQLSRLMVMMPPRHGKSEETSRLFPGYVLRRHPDWWVALTSYGAGLAYGMSRHARANFARAGGTLGAAPYMIRPNRSLSTTIDFKDGVEEWQTAAGGGMWAAGVGGSQTGRGYHVGIVDDPIKDAAEASSAVIRAKHQDWWQSTFLTRQEPDAAIVITQTRWDEDDLSGYLLRMEDENEDDRQNWHIICLSAIRDKHVYQWPASCTVAPDWREIGEPLCPARFPLAKLRSLMAGAKAYWAEALYQQRPSATVGKGRVYIGFDSDNVESLPAFTRPRTIGRQVHGDAEIWVGMDFNVNPMSAVVARKVTDQLHVFDEIELMDSNTEMMCAEIKRRYPGTKVQVTPDPAGKQRKTSAKVGQTDFSIIREHFTLFAPKAAPARVDRYNSVNALLGLVLDVDDQGEIKLIKSDSPRLFIDPRCEKLIKYLQRLIYRPGTNKPDERSGYVHMTDALGYLVWWHFPAKRQAPAGHLRFSR